MVWGHAAKKTKNKNRNVCGSAALLITDIKVQSAVWMSNWNSRECRIQATSVSPECKGFSLTSKFLCLRHGWKKKNKDSIKENKILCPTWFKVVTFLSKSVKTQWPFFFLNSLIKTYICYRQDPLQSETCPLHAHVIAPYVSVNKLEIFFPPPLPLISCLHLKQ